MIEMVYLPELVSYLVPIAAVMMLSIACALVKEKGTFSTNTFLISAAIGILVLIWADQFPTWALVVSAMLIAAVLFKDSSGEGMSNP